MMIRRVGVVQAPLKRLGLRSYSNRSIPEWMPALLEKEGGGYNPQRAGILDQPVDWGHMDAMRHVNNVQYLKYFEAARVNFLTGLEREFFGRNKFLAGDGVGPILRNIEMFWRYPIVYPDSISVIHRVDNVGADRFTLKGVVISHKAQKVAARITETQVTVDYGAGTTKAPVPDEWRQIFDALLKEQAEAESTGSS